MKPSTSHHWLSLAACAVVFAVGMGVSQLAAAASKTSAASVSGRDVPVAGARIAVEQATYDFGEVQAGDAVSHTFVLRNDGDAALHIEKVELACGCTTAKLKTTTLAPGASVDLNVAVSLKGRFGAQRKSVIVSSNDSRMPKLTLWVTGKVIVPVAATPASLFFGQVHPKATVARTVDITAEDGKPLRIDHIEIVPRDDAGPTTHPAADTKPAAASEWSAKLKTVVAASVYRVTVTSPGGSGGGATSGGGGMHDAVLRIHTNKASLPVLHVPLSAVVAGELSYVPRTILLLSGAKKPVTRYIIVSRIASGETPKPFKITGIDAPSKAVQTQVKAVGSHGYRIRLSNVLADPTLDGKDLVIHTDVEPMSTIRIPFKIEQTTETQRHGEAIGK